MMLLPVILPPAMLPPGELSPSQACFRLYFGRADLESVDYGQPVLSIPDQCGELRLPAAVLPAERSVYVLRRLSAAGVEEHNTSVCCFVEVNDVGTLQPPPLPRPTCPSASALSDGSWLVGLGFNPRPGENRPEAVVLYGRQADTAGAEPAELARLSLSRPGQRQFVFHIDAPSCELLLTARTVLGEQTSAPSRPIRLATSMPPAPPQLLPEFD